MGDPEVQLPESVEALITVICTQQRQPPPGTPARKELANLSEEEALRTLTKIQNSDISKSFDGFIIYMARKSRGGGARSGSGDVPSPQCRHSAGPPVSPASGSPRVITSTPSKRSKVLDFSAAAVDEITISTRECGPSSPLLANCVQKLSVHLNALYELEFRKAFLVLTYIGRHKLENVASVDEICSFQKLPSMLAFESHVWNKFGQHYCDKKDRLRVTHLHFSHAFICFLFFCVILLPEAWICCGLC